MSNFNFKLLKLLKKLENKKRETNQRTNKRANERTEEGIIDKQTNGQTNLVIESFIELMSAAKKVLYLQTPIYKNKSLN